VALFTKRDRIAIGIIMILIVAGWAVRYFIGRATAPEPVVIHSAVPLPAAFVSPETTGVASLPLAAPLDLNTATAGELAGLPLIGPAKAAAIIAYREVHGPFRRVDDITDVPGIGPATLARIRSGIAIAPSSDKPEPADSTVSYEK